MWAAFLLPFSVEGKAMATSEHEQKKKKVVYKQPTWIRTLEHFFLMPCGYQSSHLLLADVASPSSHTPSSKTLATHVRSVLGLVVLMESTEKQSYCHLKATLWDRVEMSCGEHEGNSISVGGGKLSDGGSSRHTCNRVPQSVINPQFHRSFLLFFHNSFTWWSVAAPFSNSTA